VGLQEMKAVASWPLHLAVATTIPARHTAFDLASQADAAVGACMSCGRGRLSTRPQQLRAYPRRVGVPHRRGH
jgi:hypothetical protein